MGPVLPLLAGSDLERSLSKSGDLLRLYHQAVTSATVSSTEYLFTFEGTEAVCGGHFALD